MLKNVPSLLSPELLYALARMGHGDEIVLSDGNFPGESIARENGAVLIRCDAVGVPPLLDAVLQMMPLDAYDNNVFLMNKTAADAELEVPIWQTYREQVAPHTDKEPVFLERFDFYERAKKAFAVVVTGEKAIYANVILKKGVVKE